MKVSLLVHNVNRASALDRCLASIKGQSYRPLELVLLDAGSTDASPDLIERYTASLRESGIGVVSVSCPLMGVSASRNYAASLATGDLLCCLDNDAAFEGDADVQRMAELFESQLDLGLVSFRVLDGDTPEIDPTTWVFRRHSAVWGAQAFRTFTFAGAGFCVRREAFRSVGGFWEALQYSREEEDLGMALINLGWELRYSPAITIRHYSDQRGRQTKPQRRYVEMRNGLWVLWRRLPMALALPAVLGRVLTMSLRALLRERQSVSDLLAAVPAAVAQWHRASLRRSPIKLGSVWRYALLHLQR